MHLNLVLRLSFCLNLIVLAVFASCAMKMLIDAGGKALTKSTPQILKRRDETAVREVVVEIHSSTGVWTVELRRCYTNGLVNICFQTMLHSRLVRLTVKTKLHCAFGSACPEKLQ